MTASSRRPPRRRGAALLLTVTLVLAAALAGCAPGADDPPRYTLDKTDPPPVDVAAPELRAMRADLGIDPCDPGPGQPVDGGLPAITLPCLGGGADVDLATLRGPLVLSYWGAWCAPCRREMPVIQEFYERAGGRVAVLGVNFQDNIPLEAMKLLRKTGATFPSVADPAGLTSAQRPIPKIINLPLLMLIDADGRVVHQEFVEMKSAVQLSALVEEHLGVRV